jgi:hypothetical protein
MTQLPLTAARHPVFSIVERSELGRWADYPEAVLEVAKSCAAAWEVHENKSYGWGASPDLRKRKYVMMAVAMMDTLKEVKDRGGGKLF